MSESPVHKAHALCHVGKTLNPQPVLFFFNPIYNESKHNVK